MNNECDFQIVYVVTRRLECVKSLVEFELYYWFAKKMCNNAKDQVKNDKFRTGAIFKSKYCP